MTTRNVRRMSLVASMPMMLCACGGGGTDAAPTTVNPATAAFPAATLSRAALPVPSQTAFPASPIASPGGPNLDGAPPNTLLPLLQVAIAKDFAGDSITTTQGATINLKGNPGQMGLTLNNESLDVVDATASTLRGRNPDGYYAFGTSIPASRSLGIYLNRLQHVLHGNWGIGGGGAGAFIGGYVSPPAALGSASSGDYAGPVDGLYDERYPGIDAWLSGSVRLHVDFGARSVTGVIAGVRIYSENALYPTMDDITINAVLDLATGRFDGSLEITRPYLGSPESGVISGRVFGPTAAEIGAVWTLSGYVDRFVGSFGATRVEK